MLLCLLSLLISYQQTSPGSKTELTVGAGLKKQSKEAYDLLSIYGAYYRAKLRQNMTSALASLDQKIQTLASKTKEASSEIQEKYSKTVKDWRQQREAFEGKLKEARANWLAAWEATKKQISERIKDLKHLYDPPNSSNS